MKAYAFFWSDKQRYNVNVSPTTGKFQHLFMKLFENKDMLCSQSNIGDFHIQTFSCREECTYERGKPLNISTSLDIGPATQGAATVKIEVFRKNFWLYERIYSKTVHITLKNPFGQSEQFNVCIPGYETEEFNSEQQLKMKVLVTLNEESVFREA